MTPYTLFSRASTRAFDLHLMPPSPASILHSVPYLTIDPSDLSRPLYLQIICYLGASLSFIARGRLFLFHRTPGNRKSKRC